MYESGYCIRDDVSNLMVLNKLLSGPSNFVFLL